MKTLRYNLHGVLHIAKSKGNNSPVLSVRSFGHLWAPPKQIAPVCFCVYIPLSFSLRCFSLWPCPYDFSASFTLMLLC